MNDDISQPTRRTRKELKATIRALRSEVAALQSTIRNRPPVFTVDGQDLEGCAVIITEVTVERDYVAIDGSGGKFQHIPGPAVMALIATGPFPDNNFSRGPFWLIPQPRQ